jgi:tRNA(Ile)-lysidine synthetase-like protein
MLSNPEEKYIDNIHKRIGRIIYKYKLIEKNDKILVALSGGKDSIILLESLVNRKKYLPFQFELHACFVFFSDIGYTVDKNYLQKFCNDLKVPFTIKEDTLNIKEESKKDYCFYCSWKRRKILFDLAGKLKCTKIAFGHHLDDAVETLFLNMFFHASISSLPYKLQMFNGKIEIIRPLLKMQEKELEKYSKLKKYKKEDNHCPYQDENKRKKIKSLLSELERLYPKFKINVFKSMDNIYTGYLPKK